MTAISTHGFATLLACPPGFGGRKLVRGAPPVRGATTQGGNLALALLTHAGEAAAPDR